MSRTREDFIKWLGNNGVSVKWIDGYKYLTFKDSEGHVCRDNKLFDERFLKSNLEIYFALGGCASVLAADYYDYKTPGHKPNATMTVTGGLLRLLGDALTLAPPQRHYTPEMLTTHDRMELDRLEEILGRKVSADTFISYSAQDKYKRENGMYM